ncbi:pantoate--beta-alanine ligase [Erythrobacter sp. W53]|uniref:pantoate--beta-alanine ligase n=1 Tax=Erythrobacter sp. W53 TaxID=3425947 RepID=UPI003D766D0B
MQTITKLKMLRNTVDGLRAGGARIALVPTMGALHEGHLTLVRAARAAADHVVVSIFVNPTQFGEGEDLDAYPRQLAADSALLEAEDVSAIWAPAPEEVYPQGYATNVSVAGVSSGLCGDDRPGHFDGVATVVCKLFNQVRPDCAFFGEKDWQQLAVIRRMSRDLDLTLPHVDAVHGVPTVREEDGLAMSSRNAYLSKEQRAAAGTLPRAMQAAIAAMKSGVAAAGALKELEDTLLTSGFESIDYAELRDADTIELANEASENTRLFLAARIGGTRLIDNMPAALNV